MIPDFRFQVPGSRFQIPDSRFQVPGNSKFIIQNSKFHDFRHCPEHSRRVPNAALSTAEGLQTLP